MSETKHSLGPWVVRVGNMWRHDKPEEKCLCLAVASRNPQPGFEGAMVCSVAPAGYITEQDQANAQLLAAAPELLEALQQVMRDCGNGSLDHSIITIEAIEAAITNATQG